MLLQTNIQPGDEVLDAGCGTGTLAIAAACSQPAAQVTGLDGDEKIIALAARKVTQADRVLRPGGRRHVADWGAPQNPAMRVAFQAIRLLDGYQSTADNVAGRLPLLFAEAGCARVTHTRDYATVFGTLALYSAMKPS